ncbi:MAG: hypothetical protein CPSOU_2059 [uncultured Paraburkholderia sp.]|nr:MAG: hypothetical protein CPSOU_2059 [uncultured Paraburkholderia sp.]
MTKTENLNGKQQGEESAKRFASWITERNTAHDWDDYVRAGKLNRSEIAMECGFDRAAFRQNSNLAKLLDATEKQLADDGILSRPRGGYDAADAEAARTDEATVKRIMSTKGKVEQRLKAVEEQNAALRAEATALRAEVAELKAQLAQYKMID